MKSPVRMGKTRKKNVLIRTWDRCMFFLGSNKKRVAPEGFFPVYVGPEKQWFAVKTKYVNHPLFQMLLEEAETEYGYNTPGPILLPCEVDIFYMVVAEMEGKEMGLSPCFLGYRLCCPFINHRRQLVKAGGDQMGKGHGYGVLNPSPLIKMN